MILSGWFEIDELDYCQYVLQGYEITAGSTWVMWRLNGKVHRTDGPAWIHADGYESWYLNDLKFTEDEWRRQVETQQLV